jgi:hypothetical protein
MVRSRAIRGPFPNTFENLDCHFRHILSISDLANFPFIGRTTGYLLGEQQGYLLGEQQEYLLGEQQGYLFVKIIGRNTEKVETFLLTTTGKTFHYTIFYRLEIKLDQYLKSHI